MPTADAYQYFGYSVVLCCTRRCSRRAGGVRAECQGECKVDRSVACTRKQTANKQTKACGMRSEWHSVLMRDAHRTALPDTVPVCTV
jgi:hypothetical protein